MSQVYQSDPGGPLEEVHHSPSETNDTDIDIDMAPSPASSTGDEGTRYICLDTNILVHHLPLVAQLHLLFSSGGGESSTSAAQGYGGWCLLIPTVVINELDKLSSSSAPALQGHFDAPLTIGDLTQAATQWLGRVGPSASRTASPAPSESCNGGARPARAASRLRLQAWDERLHPPTSLTKADDRVLDCCLFYRQRLAARVVLWTQDRNLAILATANRVDVLRVPHLSLAGVAMALKLDLPARLPLADGGHANGQHGMDLDHDLHADDTANDHLRALLPDNTIFAAPTPDLPSRIPPHARSRSHPRSHKSTPPSTPPSSRHIPLDILRQIDAIFFPLASYLAHLSDRPAPPHPDSPSAHSDPARDDHTPATSATATALLQHAYDSFDHLDATRFPPIVPGHTTMTPDRVALLRAMACLRTLCLFLVPRDARRPRTGEVIEGLQTLVEQLDFLHVPIDAPAVARLVDGIQHLSSLVS